MTRFISDRATSHPNPRLIVSAAGLALLWAGIATTYAGDWPQILGPHRNGEADVEQLGDRWPEAGVRRLWARPVGRGYAGVAVRGKRVVLFHRLADQEVVEALDAGTGQRLWKTEFAAHYRGGIFPEEDGPLCVPVIHGERVYVFGAGGDLHALELADGKHVWSRALYREFRKRGGQIDFGYFGAGSTPLVEGDQLLVNVGGFGEAGLVAIATDDGKTRWKATDELPSYSSPVAATINGDRHVIFVTRYNVVSVDPVDGSARFRFAFGKRGPTVNAATPLIRGNRLFVTASYGVGAVLADVGRKNTNSIWANDETLSSQYATSVYHDGYLYGVDGRADVGSATLRCVKFETGDVLWSQEDFGVASLILADGKLLIVKNDGRLVLARPTPKRYQQLAESRLCEGPVRALPALANGKLYIRDPKALMCFELPPR